MVLILAKMKMLVEAKGAEEEDIGREVKQKKKTSGGLNDTVYPTVYRRMSDRNVSPKWPHVQRSCQLVHGGPRLTAQQEMDSCDY